ncbi:MAG: response regulator, partial [Selenomonadaceae bacterium]|nr:response regulator [Selenomonadaceae bacterium]
KMLLESEGFIVDTATDGSDAVDKVSKAQAGDFDLILMDIQMPIMDGYTATKKIRELADPKLANLPIIAMTANAFSEDVKAALDAGMNAHIAKPIEIPKMLETLAKILPD